MPLSEKVRLKTDRRPVADDRRFERALELARPAFGGCTITPSSGKCYSDSGIILQIQKRTTKSHEITRNKSLLSVISWIALVTSAALLSFLATLEDSVGFFLAPQEVKKKDSVETAAITVECV